MHGSCTTWRRHLIQTFYVSRGSKAWLDLIPRILPQVHEKSSMTFYMQIFRDSPDDIMNTNASIAYIIWYLVIRFLQFSVWYRTKCMAAMICKYYHPRYLPHQSPPSKSKAPLQRIGIPMLKIGRSQDKRSGPRLNIKTVLSTYGDFHVKDKTVVRTSYL